MCAIIGKFSILKKSTNIISLYTCQRWSVIAPLVVYLMLFVMVKLASIPLRSGLHNAAAKNLQTLKQDGSREGIREDEKLSGPNANIILEDIFHKADNDKDEYLSQRELTDWISQKTQEHIHEAMMENYGLFTTIDNNPRNGVISWAEYHKYFLEQHGLSSEYVSSHSEKHPGLTRTMREAIMRDKAAWSETAKTDPDHLTVDEFLAFRHPESSHSSILALVEDLIEKFDRDGDDVLTEEEFASLQTDVDGVSNSLSPMEAERRREFKESVDVSKDGKATRQELLMYIDPKNPRHARDEADTLIILADTDHDGRLSLQEIINKSDLFLGSKMVDIARSFHDEF